MLETTVSMSLSSAGELFRLPVPLELSCWSITLGKTCEIAGSRSRLESVKLQIQCTRFNLIVEANNL